MKVMIVVTHLLGTGHLARALTLGRAFVAAGDQVTVVSGGSAVTHFDASGIDLRHLPAVRSNGIDFTMLLTDEGSMAAPEHMQARRDQLIGILSEVSPDVLITELFPFGRRILHDEFTALLRSAHGMQPRPLVLSSIRDILAPPSKPAKVTFADDMVNEFYDGVLVHSDPDLVPLERSWPVSMALSNRLHYTGFVAPAPPHPMPGGRSGVVVSAGGGSVGDVVFEAAIDAAYLMPNAGWLLLAGGPEARRERLTKMAPPHVKIEPPRPDFRRLLQRAAASVSMCGYNTALDVLQTGVPSVLIPFDDGAEVEQGLRADALSDQNGITVLRQSELGGLALIRALADVQAATARIPRMDGMNGAARTVEIVRDLRARALP